MREGHMLKGNPRTWDAMCKVYKIILITHPIVNSPITQPNEVMMLSFK